MDLETEDEPQGSVYFIVRILSNNFVLGLIRKEWGPVLLKYRFKQNKLL